VDLIRTMVEKEDHGGVSVTERETVATALESHVLELRALLDNPGDGRWAYRVCMMTRRVHVDVWMWGPDPGFVTDVVIPLLGRARNAALAVPDTGEYSTSVGAFARNIAKRISNLNRYVRGEGCAIDPNDLLEEPAETS